MDRLKKQLAGDKTCTACWSTMRDPQLVGALARQNYDAVVLDMQHGFHNEESVLAAIVRIVMAGKSPLVRLPVEAWDMAEKVLDFGALGVIAPMINNGKDAARFAHAAKFPGTGARSYGPRYAADLYGITPAKYMEQANDLTLCLAMIETREAYDNLDDILSTDGIDGILMGPSDFSISVRNNLQPDAYGPDTIELVEDIAKRTRAVGKIATAFTMQAAHANLVHGFGYRLISLAMDSGIVQTGAANSFEGGSFA